MVSAYFDTHRGGIELVAGRLARELCLRAVDVTWMATDATEPPAHLGCGRATAIRASNATEHRAGIPFPIPGQSGVATIWREVKQADVVVMHDGLYATNVVTMLAARHLRKPVVLVQHIGLVHYGNPALRMLMRVANATVARHMLAAANQVVFISNTVAQYFAAVPFKVAPRLIFNGVDTEMFTPPDAEFDQAHIRVSLGLPVDRPIALFVGRFVEKKGLHVIERMAKQRPDITFALAGWGVIDPTAWKLPNVHVLSGLEGDSLVPLYRASDAFVLPSVGEGLPLVLQEALACGLPVICGSETATADPDASGHVVGAEIDNSDPERTAATFAAALDDTLGAARAHDPGMAAQARHAYVRGRYSWAEAVRSYLAIMTDLIDPPTTDLSEVAIPLRRLPPQSEQLRQDPEGPGWRRLWQ
jgi:glycosyltransferase involved in cell wall biosynthesis